MEIKISNDERQAFLIITSEDNTPQELTVDKLKQALEEKGVLKGIKESTLQLICQQKYIGNKYIVAETIPPKTGDNAKIEIKIKPKERSTYDKGVDAEKKVNHYGVTEGFITYVKSGETLATRIPPTRGQKGYTVTGKEIEGILGKDIGWLNFQGENTKVSGNNLIAVKNGVLNKEDSKLNIQQNITLEQDLGIKTGSIILPLEANIEMVVPGDIKSGFTVQCYKITVFGNVEDAKITAKILEVKRGIVGTSDMPIIADNLTTNFIIGKRKIIAKFVDVKREITGGSTIQSDFVHSNVIQECSIIARYGVWTNYLYGSNNILVGVDISESEEYNKWEHQLKGVENALKEMKSSNQQLLKKADSIREMAKRMPNNPSIKNELQKVNEIITKINKIETIKNALEKKLQSHRDKTYISGSPFILVEYGFTKKAMIKDRKKAINNLTIKEISYERSKPLITGLYTLSNDVIIANPKYNINDFKDIMENYKNASLN